MKPIYSFKFILFLATLLLWNVKAFTQTVSEESVLGTWNIQGTLMGDDGAGWLMPHKQANPDCEADHTVFSKDHTAKEVKYNSSCEAKENAYDWKLENNVLTLIKGERTMTGHIKSIEDGTMTVGISISPNSEKRMYVVYKKRD